MLRLTAAQKLLHKKDIGWNIKSFTTISDGLEIHGRIRLPLKYPAPAIICSHGLFSNKDGSKFVALTKHLAEKGFVAVRYDHLLYQPLIRGQRPASVTNLFAF